MNPASLRNVTIRQLIPHPGSSSKFSNAAAVCIAHEPLTTDELPWHLAMKIPLFSSYDSYAMHKAAKIMENMSIDFHRMWGLSSPIVWRQFRSLTCVSNRGMHAAKNVVQQYLLVDDETIVHLKPTDAFPSGKWCEDFEAREHTGGIRLQ